MGSEFYDDFQFHSTSIWEKNGPLCIYVISQVYSKVGIVLFSQSYIIPFLLSHPPILVSSFINWEFK